MLVRPVDFRARRRRALDRRTEDPTNRSQQDEAGERTRDEHP